MIYFKDSVGNKRHHLEVQGNELIQILKFIPQGPVVQKPINANLRLKINQGVLFLYSQLLFNGDTGQNFTLEEVNLEIQEEATETFTPKLKT